MFPLFAIYIKSVFDYDHYKDERAKTKACAFIGPANKNYFLHYNSRKDSLKNLINLEKNE